MPITTCLFDLDGTLVDSITLIVDSFRHAISAHTSATPSDEDLIAGIGTPLLDQLGQYTESSDTVDAMVESYRDYYIEKHNTMVTAYPGVKEGVAALCQQGIKLGVVTSKNQEGARRSLDHTGLTNFFRVIIAIEDTDEHKPNAAPVLAALKALEATPEEAIFVGDSTHDLQAGRNAGVITAAVGWTPFQHDSLRSCRPDLWLKDARSDFPQIPALAEAFKNQS